MLTPRPLLISTNHHRKYCSRIQIRITVGIDTNDWRYRWKFCSPNDQPYYTVEISCETVFNTAHSEWLFRTFGCIRERSNHTASELSTTSAAHTGTDLFYSAYNNYFSTINYKTLKEMLFCQLVSVLLHTAGSLIHLFPYINSPWNNCVILQYISKLTLTLEIIVYSQSMVTNWKKMFNCLIPIQCQKCEQHQMWPNLQKPSFWADFTWCASFEHN